MLELQENQFDPYFEEVKMLPIVKILEPTDSLKWKTTRFPHTEATFVYEYFNFKVLKRFCPLITNVTLIRSSRVMTELITLFSIQGISTRRFTGGKYRHHCCFPSFLALF